MNMIVIMPAIVFVVAIFVMPVIVRMIVRMIVVVMLVLAFITVSMIMIADSCRFFESEQIEECDKGKTDSGDQGIDSEARVQMPFDSAGRIKIDKDASPDEKGYQGADFEDLFHE